MTLFYFFGFVCGCLWNEWSEINTYEADQWLFIIQRLTTVSYPLALPLIILQLPLPPVPSPNTSCFHTQSLHILLPPFRHFHLTHHRKIPLFLLPPLLIVIPQLGHPIHPQSVWSLLANLLTSILQQNEAQEVLAAHFQWS